MQLTSERTITPFPDWARIDLLIAPLVSSLHTFLLSAAQYPVFFKVRPYRQWVLTGVGQFRHECARQSGDVMQTGD
jgi:hypothetical protein